ncbi:MAG: orotidine-5'-phosphate decarboxylase [Granulosicoccaceae bacterium]
MQDSKRLIVALDYAGEEQALAMADALDPTKVRVKVGKELFTRCGPPLLKALQQRGFEVFLDLKFHDIPNTVAGGARAAADLGAWMLTLHAGNGGAALRAARTAIDEMGSAMHLVGVTVLTSLDDAQLAEVGVLDGARAQVARLAALAAECQMSGIVCSAQELALVRGILPSDSLTVTPGIRQSGDAADDQNRTMGPGEAVAAGASYLVVGRPITRAPSPMQAVQNYLNEIQLS